MPVYRNTETHALQPGDVVLVVPSVNNPGAYRRAMTTDQAGAVEKTVAYVAMGEHRSRRYPVGSPRDVIFTDRSGASVATRTSEFLVKQQEAS